MNVLFSFLSASVLLTLSPGPDLLMVIAQSLEKGRKAAFHFVGGLLTGLCGHTLLLIFGWAQFIGERPSIVKYIKWAGFLYFSYLGIHSIYGQFQTKVNHKSALQYSNKNSYWQGVLMNGINPKVSIFFWLFFPGFLFTTSIPIAFQYAILGGLFLLQAGIVFSMTIFFATQMKDFFGHYRFELLTGILWLVLAGYLLVN